MNVFLQRQFSIFRALGTWMGLFTSREVGNEAGWFSHLLCHSSDHSNNPCLFSLKAIPALAMRQVNMHPSSGYIVAHEKIRATFLRNPFLQIWVVRSAICFPSLHLYREWYLLHKAFFDIRRLPFSHQLSNQFGHSCTWEETGTLILRNQPWWI